MKWQVCMVMLVVAAGCGDNLSGDADSFIKPTDADTDAPADAPIEPPVDALIDTTRPNLTEICGAEPPAASAAGYLDYWENCYRTRWCEWEVGCLPLNSYRNVQECLEKSDSVEGGRLSAERRERERAVGQERSSLNIPAFTQCLAETSGAYCNTARFSVACATRFTGIIHDGDTCYADVECASPGAECKSNCTDACCVGTCQPKFKEGQACNEFDSCEPGLRCHNICIRGDIGTSCASDRDCDSNAWCDLKAGLCKPDFAPGAACTNPLQCGGETSCVGLTITDSTPGRCLRISKEGDLCDYFCYGNLYCDSSGTCRNLPQIGQSCSGFAPCSGVDTVCNNGQCILRGDGNAPCSDIQPCQPGWFCTSELNNPTPTCVRPGDPGQPCTAPSHCKSYRCSGNTNQPGMCLPWSDTCPLSEM
jgi:hypothetical protein